MNKVLNISMILGCIAIFLSAIKAYSKEESLSNITIDSKLQYLSAKSIKESSYDLIQNQFAHPNIFLLLENKLRKNNWIKDVQVYRGIDNSIHLSLTERQPILRVFDKWDNTFFIDNKLTKMDAQSIKKSMTSILLNYPQYKIDTPLLSTLVRWVKFIKSNSQVAKYFSYFDYIDNKNIAIIPITGSPISIIPINADVTTVGKQLATFYGNILPQIGWRYYKELNFKFNNQIIATKN